jgi:hypothetical protein
VKVEGRLGGILHWTPALIPDEGRPVLDYGQIVALIAWPSPLAEHVALDSTCQGAREPLAIK